jgi:hypothetical protein
MRVLTRGLTAAIALCLSGACSDNTDALASAATLELRTLTISSKTIDADSASHTSVTVSVNGIAPFRAVPIILSTTAGTFDQPTGKGATTIQLLPDASGNAQATLRSGVVPTTAVVRAVLDKSVREDTVRFSPVGVTAVTIQETSVDADGASTITVLATVPSNAPASNRKVQFSTTLGTLAPSTATGPGAPTSNLTVDADADGHAIAVLRASRSTGTAVVTARTGTIARSDSVQFTTAYPEWIDVEPLVAALKRGAAASTTVSAVLRRSVGWVSTGLRVFFEADFPGGSAVGTIGPSAVTDTAGKASVSLGLADTVFVGPVVLSAHSQGRSGSDVTGKATILITR